MRERSKILGSLESIYREAFGSAEAAGDQTEMSKLDLGYQRDQIYLEALLDIRDALVAADEDKPEIFHTESSAALETGGS